MQKDEIKNMAKIGDVYLAKQSLSFATAKRDEDYDVWYCDPGDLLEVVDIEMDNGLPTISLRTKNGKKFYCSMLRLERMEKISKHKLQDYYSLMPTPFNCIRVKR